jgi:hypothetical protein
MIDGRQNPPIAVADLVPERILWPEFFEFDGMILVKDGFDRRVYDTYLASFRSKQEPHPLSLEERLEGLLNKRYLKDIFLGTGYIPDRKTLQQLGEMLESNWQTKLNLEFPGRNMEARFVMEFENTGFAGWWISAWRNQDKSNR